MTYEMVSSIETLGVQFARQEIRGLDYHRPLVKLLQDLQQHRDISAAWLSGDPAFKERLDSKTADVENDVKKVDEIDRGLNGVLRIGTEWTALNASIRELLAISRGLPADQNFLQHTKVIAHHDRADHGCRRPVEPHP